jgi:hypothetical protein
VLVVDLVPGVVRQGKIEAGQNDAAAGKGGGGGEQIGGGGGRAGGSGGDDQGLGRRRSPARRQAPQQRDPAGGDVHQPELGQAGWPGDEGEAQELRRQSPVAREVTFHQRGDPGRIALLLHLAGVEETRQGVGKVEGFDGVDRALEQARIGGHEPGQLEPAALRIDRRRQLEGFVGGLERRLALLEVAQSEDPRQQRRRAGRRLDEGGRQLAAGPAGRQQDQGRGHRLRLARREHRRDAGRQIGQERLLGLDREPPGRGLLEERGRHGRPGAGRPARVCCAASRAAGSPTCIHQPSMTAPKSRPRAWRSIQWGKSGWGPPGQASMIEGESICTPM